MPSKSTTTFAACAALGLGAAALTLTMSPAQAAPVTETFEVPGALDFVVPDGVCALEYDVYGASGGTAADGNVPGLGGRASGTLEVTPGESLVIVVGGEGGDAQQNGDAAPNEADVNDEGLSPEGASGTPGEGGFNGGADGGSASAGGGGGGGASDIRQGGSALTDRVVVAGGGGGSGAETSNEKNRSEGIPTEGVGGDGGGAVGTDGIASNDGADGGLGGTQTAGGAGGANDPTAGDGTLGDGGVGGSGNNDNDSGGGGGGGYYGGGGGSGDTFIPVPSPDGAAPEGGESTDDGGGGGGGSGFGPAGVAFETGVQEGDGLVTLTYDTEGETCDPDVIPDDTTPDPVVAGRPPFTG